MPNLTSYNSGTCTIPNVTYSGEDAIYKVWLHEGNRVAFRLDVQKPADLVLALIKSCSDENGNCVSNSTDFIGSQVEEIPAAHYDPDPGIYYLVVDSTSDEHCGAYTLTVTGDNPTPDLMLDIASPDTVVAGKDLKYRLTVTNRGALDATGVEITQTLPEGVQFVSASPNCTGSGRTVLCSIGNLAVDTSAQTIEITVKVHPATRGELNQAGQHVLPSTASVKANEGDPIPDDNSNTVTTEVIAISDLSIETLALPEAVVAGRVLTYKFRVHNAGPSDATRVVMTDALQGDVKPNSRCESQQVGVVLCTNPTIATIAAHESAEVSFTVRVEPSAKDDSVVKSTILVAAVEPEPDPDLGANSVSFETSVLRRANLSVNIDFYPTTVVAGTDLKYQITVFNHGPSESSKGTVTSTLTFDPMKLHNTATEPRAATIVTCSFGLISPGRSETVTCTVPVKPSEASGTIIFNTASVAGKAPDFVQDNNTSGPVETRVKVVADLELVGKTPKAVSKLGLTNTDSVDAGENLLYELEVRNNGPSDSQGGAIRDALPNELTFVASPDGCTKHDGDPSKVSCPVRPLETRHTFTASFVAKVAAGAMGTIENTASVKGRDDPDSSTFIASTMVTQKADLAVTLSDSPDAVVSPNLVAYTLTVTNKGPSDATGVTASLMLPKGA